MKDIYDVMICPYCKSDNTYVYSNEETVFGLGEGTYVAHCHCADCEKDFGLKMEFSYNVEKSTIRAYKA